MIQAFFNRFARSKDKMVDQENNVESYDKIFDKVIYYMYDDDFEVCKLKQYAFLTSIRIYEPFCERVLLILSVVPQLKKLSFGDGDSIPFLKILSSDKFKNSKCIMEFKESSVTKLNQPRLDHYLLHNLSKLSNIESVLKRTEIYYIKGSLAFKQGTQELVLVKRFLSGWIRTKPLEKLNRISEYNFKNDMEFDVINNLEKSYGSSASLFMFRFNLKVDDDNTSLYLP